jgi:FixJ family two-component response regulator
MMLSKPAISIVDDDHSVREATVGLMRAMGFIAKAFPSAQEFLQSSRMQLTTCLIADVRMPAMNGLELYARLVAAGRPIPTILMTAFPDERLKAQALNSGVIRFLTKPFSEEELLAGINAAVERKPLSPVWAD